jgi:hypothetical protein
MQFKCLIAALSILFVGICLFGVSSVHFGIVTEYRSQQIGNQTGFNGVEYRIYSPMSTEITFEIDGNYTSSGVTWLKVYNQKTEVIANHLVNAFPFKVEMPDYGQYTALFDNLILNSTAVLKASTNSPVVKEQNPLSALSNVAAILTVIGAVVFAVGFRIELIGKFTKRKEKIEKREGEPEYFLNLRQAIGYYTLFSPIIVFIIAFAYVVPYSAQMLPMLNDILIRTAISLIPAVLIFIYYVFVERFLQRISITENFEHLTKVSKLSRFIMILVLALAIYYTIVLSVFRDISVVSATFNYLVGAVLLYIIFVPFINMFTTEGSTIVYLLKFQKEFTNNPNSADYKLLASVSKGISDLLRPINVMVSETSLSLGMSYYTILNKNITDIQSIQRMLEKSPISFEQFLPIIERLVSYSCFLDFEGVKALPPLSERIGKSLGVVASIVVAIAAIVPLLIQYL